MKAYELHPEEGLAALKLVERPTPGPLGPTAVRVRLRAASLNYRDLVMLKQAKRRKAPGIPLSDGAGEVVAVGDHVSRVKPGDKVCGAFFPGWLSGAFKDEHHGNALGGSADGALAQEMVLDEKSWVKIPQGWSFEQAATLPCAGVTAWNALYESAAIQAGDTVLVQGTGGVSIFALQLAKKAGATVVATSSSAEKRARLEQMGASVTIDYKENPKWGDAARAATGGRGVDIAVEVGGAGTFDQSARALRYMGTMSLIGVLTGTQAPVDTYQLVHKALRVHGLYVGSVAMFEDLVKALEVSKIEPVIDRVFPFAEARAAYEHLQSGKHFGKVVIRID
jgi:NADPH:quinone reductase-like Zn-dependent oxidoreductase